MKSRLSMVPGWNRNWWVGMEKSGLVISATPGSRKSEIFWLASTTMLSLLRTRFMAFRI